MWTAYYGTTCIIGTIFLLWFSISLDMVNLCTVSQEYKLWTISFVKCSRCVTFDSIQTRFYGAIVLETQVHPMPVAFTLKSIKNFSIQSFFVMFFIVVNQTPEWRIFYCIIHIYFCHFRMKSLFLLRIMGYFMIWFLCILFEKGSVTVLWYDAAHEKIVSFFFIIWNSISFCFTYLNWLHSIRIIWVE